MEEGGAESGSIPVQLCDLCTGEWRAGRLKRIRERERSTEKKGRKMRGREGVLGERL